jgi:hypothetical protein
MSDYTMVPVTEILQTVQYSCDFGRVDDREGDTLDDQRTAFWQEVIANKAGDTGFGHLVESILKHGFIAEAAIGWAEDRLSINEGHHRLVAAILLCLDEVPVSNWGGYTEKVTLPPGRDYFSAHRNSDDPYSFDVEF